MPKAIQVGSVTAALQRAFGFKGKFTPMLDEIVVPVYVIQDPAPAVKTRLVAATAEITAPTPADPTEAIAHVRLWNHPKTGVLGVVNFVHIQITTDQDTVQTKPWLVRGFIVKTNVTPPGAGATVPGLFRDTRFTAAEKPALEIRSLFDNVGSGSDFFTQFNFTTGLTGAPAQRMEAESSDPRQPLAVLSPGSYLEVNIPEATIIGGEPKLRVNFQWLEIPITELDPAGGLPG